MQAVKRFGLWFLGALAILSALPLSLNAATLSQGVSPEALSQNSSALIKAWVESVAAQTEHRREVEVGQLPRNLPSGTCKTIVPFLPAGQKLWGRGHIGLKCSETVSWTAFVPVHVHYFAPVAHLVRHLKRGEPIAPADVRWSEADLTTGAADLIHQPERLLGKTAARHLTAQQKLRPVDLSAQTAIAAGQAVDILVQSGAVTVRASGVSLNRAAAGEKVRVRLENGRVVFGTAQNSGVVALLI